MAQASGTMEDFEKDLEALLRDSHPSKPSLDRERELNLFRSGSAPPTVEGSRAAVGSLFGGGVISEEEMISNPAYLSYYDYHKNLNPRLPPPAVSNEDLISLQMLRAGAIGDRRMKGLRNGGDGSSSSRNSLFSMQPGVSVNHGDRLNRGLDGPSARRNGFVHDVQEDIRCPATISRPISRPVSRSAFDSSVGPMGGSDSQWIKLQNELLGPDDLQSVANSPRLARVQSLGSSISRSFAPSLDTSPARSITPDPKLIRRSPSPCLPPVGSRIYGTDKKDVNLNGLGVYSSCMADSSEIAASLAALSLSKAMVGDGENDLRSQPQQAFTGHPELFLKASGGHSQYMQQNLINKSDSSAHVAHPSPLCNGFLNNGALTSFDVSKPTSNGQIKLPRQSSSNNINSNVSSGFLGSNYYQNADMTNIGFTGSNSDDYSPNQRLPPMLNNQLDPGGWAYTGSTEQHLNRTAHRVESGIQLPNVDPLYPHYVQSGSDSVIQSAGSMEPSLVRDFYGPSLTDLSRYPKEYLEALLAEEKLNYGMASLNKSTASNHGFYGSHVTGFGFHSPAGPTRNSILSSLATVRPLKQKERISRVPMVRGRESIGSWNTESGLAREGFVSQLLEEFKNSKARSFELSEIFGHVVEFSSDQYGSRFIQQKLEIATIDEKEKIFTEILPSARELMIDVFGNYVIQKFFEHGTEGQRKQLANQLIGHVLPLSFQMYGCRVIQKALEVVDLDQQIQMVAELDGSVMKCVRDQNGNHVIQKCIECVPQEKIQFIISAFYGQIVTLSTHPYGCRVIQRVLEHCDDVNAQSIIIEEILQSVYTLAQDQYGNYVVQHVLQHGTREERSAIISKLSGKIVNMSQQKFASNVVEKCLTYGTAEERQRLIDEILGSTDENEPLQVMMKDQFGNYVVQKVLEICSDQNRELILARIRIHLSTLKKYTYGKHIVARVEKLLTTGERRSGIGQHSF